MVLPQRPLIKRQGVFIGGLRASIVTEQIEDIPERPSEVCRLHILPGLCSLRHGPQVWEQREQGA